MACIYGLVDPSTREVKYIGQTALSLEQKLFRHFKNPYQKNVAVWIKSLAIPPEILVIEDEPEDIDKAEKFWIAEYRSRGIELLNIADGGKGSPGAARSPETRLQLSIAHTGKVFTEQHRINIGNASRGRIHSPEARKRNSDSKIGIPTGKCPPDCTCGRHNNSNYRCKEGCTCKKHPVKS